MCMTQGSLGSLGAPEWPEKTRGQMSGSHSGENSGEAAEWQQQWEGEEALREAGAGTCCGDPLLPPRSHLCDICTNL